MSGRFEPWQPFVHGETTYDLSHLNDFWLIVRDSGKVERCVRVTFADHCFTRPPAGTSDTAPVYPGCSRPDGRFCTDRYELSLGLRAALEYAASGGIVWNSHGEHFVLIKGVNFRDARIDYAVIFSLERLRGTEFDLLMHVRTAHMRDEKPIDTFGSVRLAHLVTLVMKNKKPTKNFARNRKRPE